MQDRRQSSSFRTTIGRVDAKQQRSHCLLELAEAGQLRVSCVWVCTVDEGFYFAQQNLLSAGQPSLINISVQSGECIMAMVLQPASTNQVQWLV